MIYQPIDPHFRDASTCALIVEVAGRFGHMRSRELIAESGGEFRIEYPMNWSIVQLWWAGWKAGDL